MEVNSTLTMSMSETFNSGDYKLYFGENHTDSWHIDTSGKQAGVVVGLLVLSVCMQGALILYKMAHRRM